MSPPFSFSNIGFFGLHESHHQKYKAENVPVLVCEKWAGGKFIPVSCTACNEQQKRAGG
jgi:hypothetical protein